LDKCVSSTTPNAKNPDSTTPIAASGPAAEEDPVATKLLEKLSTKSRQRWPGDLLPEADRAPGLLPTV
jgi:hypothetical protein